MPASPPDTGSGSGPASRNDGALVIGEALIDLIRRPGQTDDARVGGSPLNVAVGLSRLEIPVVLQTRIGCDAHGALIEEHLAENEVELVARSITAGPTSTAIATIAVDGSASYEFAIDWAVAAAPDLAPNVVHTGSIAAVLEPGASVVLETIEALRATATISYDPNVRPQLMGSRESARKRIEAFVEQADVVKASDEDLEWLFPDTAPADVVRRWLRLGPALVVVTLGASGAYAAARGGAVQIPAPPTTVADTIGAGDSFMAGLLAALSDAGLLGRMHADQLQAIDLEQLRGLLEFAAGCAAVTVSRSGADPPRRDRIMAT